MDWDLNNDFKSERRLFGAAWAAMVIANLAVLGVIVWAIIKVVNHFA